MQWTIIYLIIQTFEKTHKQIKSFQFGILNIPSIKNITIFDISQLFCKMLIWSEHLYNNTYNGNTLLQHKKINRCFGLNNKSKILPVVSGFIISWLRLGADLVVHKDIVVHRPGVVCHVHIAIGGIETIGLKYTKEFSYQLIDWI